MYVFIKKNRIFLQSSYLFYEGFLEAFNLRENHSGLSVF